MKRFKILILFEHFYSAGVQLIFWAASYRVLLGIFSGGRPPEAIDHLYTYIFLLTLALSVFIHFRFIIRNFLDRQRYGVFFLLALVNIGAGTLFNELLFDKLIDYVLPGYYFISYYTFFDLAKFFFVFIAVTTLLHMSWEWWRLQEVRHHMALLEKEKVSAELRALTNQVNPHFLFNSLTVLYSLALKNTSETPEAIIRLSDILRYVIYESAKPTVPLKSEIQVIRAYIDLQRYRVDPSSSVEFTTEVEDEIAGVAPMLFLPLVENSFKHGFHSQQTDFVDMKLMTRDNHVRFLIRNRKGAPKDKTASGVGIGNIRERLRLIYPDQHTLTIHDDKEEFSVDLTLRLQP
jgi:sensor histidine kinase YesM